MGQIGHDRHTARNTPRTTKSSTIQSARPIMVIVLFPPPGPSVRPVPSCSCDESTCAKPARHRQETPTTRHCSKTASELWHEGPERAPRDVERRLQIHDRLRFIPPP